MVRLYNPYHKKVLWVGTPYVRVNRTNLLFRKDVVVPVRYCHVTSGGTKVTAPIDKIFVIRKFLLGSNAEKYLAYLKETSPADFSKSIEVQFLGK